MKFTADAKISHSKCHFTRTYRLHMQEYESYPTIIEVYKVSSIERQFKKPLSEKTSNFTVAELVQPQAMLHEVNSLLLTTQLLTRSEWPNNGEGLRWTWRNTWPSPNCIKASSHERFRSAIFSSWLCNGCVLYRRKYDFSKFLPKSIRSHSQKNKIAEQNCPCELAFSGINLCGRRAKNKKTVPTLTILIFGISKFRAKSGVG